jgi:hypothetical protein
MVSAHLQAMEFHQAGHLDKAEALYRTILIKADCRYADAHSCRGAIAAARRKGCICAGPRLAALHHGHVGSVWCAAHGAPALRCAAAMLAEIAHAAEIAYPWSPSALLHVKASKNCPLAAAAQGSGVAAAPPADVHTLSPGMVLTELLLAGATVRNKQVFNVLCEHPEISAAYTWELLHSAADALISYI